MEPLGQTPSERVTKIAAALEAIEAYCANVFDGTIASPDQIPEHATQTEREQAVRHLQSLDGRVLSSIARLHELQSTYETQALEGQHLNTPPRPRGDHDAETTEKPASSMQHHLGGHMLQLCAEANPSAAETVGNGLLEKPERTHTKQRVAAIPPVDSLQLNTPLDTKPATSNISELPAQNHDSQKAWAHAPASTAEANSAPEKSAPVGRNRDAGVQAVVAAYRLHPQVEKALQSRRTKREGLLVEGTDTSDDAYRKMVHEYRLLSFDDERALFTQIEQGLAVYEALGGNIENASTEQEQALIALAAAQQVLFHTNLRLVMDIARHYAPTTKMPYLDIVQEGNMGLLKAINRFDMRRGYHLSTYATQWIRQHITRGIADKSRAIRLPVYKNSQFSKVQYALSTRANELNRDLTRLEIEETAGMTIAEYEELRQQAASEIQSLNVLIGDDGSDMELQDILVDENSSFERETTSMAANDELSNIFADSGLNDREKFILGLRYGVQPEIVGPLLITEGDTPLAYEDCVSNHGMTLEDIGQVLGVTRERVRQLESQAMQMLKRRYRGERLA